MTEEHHPRLLVEEHHRRLLMRLQRVENNNWEIVERNQAAAAAAVSPTPSPERRPSSMPSPEFNENGEWQPLPQPPSPIYENNNGDEERQEVSPPPSPNLLVNEEEDEDVEILLLLDDNENDDGYDSDSQNMRRVREQERNDLEPEFLVSLVENLMRREKIVLRQKINELELTVKKCDEECNVVRYELDRINQIVEQSMENGSSVLAHHVQKQFLINTIHQHFVAKMEEYSRASYELQLSKNRLQIINVFFNMRRM